MKKTIIIVLLIGAIKTFSQSIENFNLKDTIYILFDDTEKFDDLHLKIIKGINNMTYSYNFPDAKSISFVTRINKFEEKIWVKKKSILDKNNIINLIDFHNIGFNNTLSVFFKKKFIFYIIDKRKFNKKKILAKRVFLVNQQQIEM